MGINEPAAVVKDKAAGLVFVGFASTVSGGGCHPLVEPWRRARLFQRNDDFLGFSVSHVEMTYADIPLVDGVVVLGAVYDF